MAESIFYKGTYINPAYASPEAKAGGVVVSAPYAGGAPSSPAPVSNSGGSPGPVIPQAIKELNQSMVSGGGSPTSVGSNISSIPTTTIQQVVGTTVDGKYGPQTTAAVKAFQQANGLVADGIVGPQTAAVINAKLNDTSLTKPNNPVAKPPAQVTPAPVTPTPVTPTVPPTTPVTPAPTTPVTPTTPVVNTPTFSGQTLQLGSTGDAVKQLQQSLGGLTVDGNFGPKTLAAVKAYQISHGLTPDGVVGPQTMASLNRPQGDTAGTVTAGMVNTTDPIDPLTGQPNPNYKPPVSTDIVPGVPSTGNPEIDSLIKTLYNQSPQKTASDVYKEVYDSMGINTMKNTYESNTKEYTDLQEEKNKEKQDINNNPWYSEGVRIQKLGQLDKKYEGKELILSNKLKLLETQIDNARADAQFITGQTLDQLQQSSKMTQDIILKAIDLAEKAAQAEEKIPASAQEYEYAVKKGYTGTFTQYQNEDTNRKAVTTKSTSTSTSTNTANNVKVITNFLKTGKDYKGTVFGNPQGKDGYVDPNIYIIASENWPGTITEFLSKFPVKNYVNPVDYSLLPEAIRPKVSSSSTSSSNDIEP